MRAFAPLYVETVEKWRRICRDLAEGREPSEEPPKRPGQQQTLPSPGSGMSPGGQPGFIKILVLRFSVVAGFSLSYFCGF